MKKLILAGLCLLAFTLKAEALGVADIPDIYNAAGVLFNHATDLYRFAAHLNELSQASFQINVIESTQAVVPSNLQKQGLIAKYQDLKAQLVTDLQALP